MAPNVDPLATFLEEARELLGELEASLIGLEKSPDNSQLIDQAFRALHTIKGSGNMFDLTDLVSLAHDAEALFLPIRDGEVAISPEIISAGLKVRDAIEHQLVEVGEVMGEDTSGWTAGVEARSESEEALRAFRLAVTGRADSDTGSGITDSVGSEDPGVGTPPSGIEESVEPGELRTFRIEYRPSAETFRNGTDPLSLIQELRDLGDATIMGQTHKVPPLEDIDPEACYLQWDFLLTTTSDENAVRDVFIFLDEDSEVMVQEIDQEGPADQGDEYKRLGDILIERGDVTHRQLERIATERGRLGEWLVREGIVSEESLQAAVAEQELVRNRRKRRHQQESISKIRVDVGKLDDLVDLVGEFVSLHARVASTATAAQNHEFASLGEQLERLVRELRDLSMDLHMVPVSTLFAPFSRVVRDLSVELGKDVQLQLEGTDTELDKNVVEALRDPLLHIVRNSIDHGLETPQRRLSIGKPATGTVRLKARHSGAFVVISIEDDGGGIDPEAIQRTAIDRGLVSAERALSKEQALDLIFEPGFSTASEATVVSGRGVGLDVVRQNVTRLNGAVSIQSERSVGTRFDIRIPLTLAIVEGLLASIGGNYYLIGLAYIVECLEYRGISASRRHRFFDYRGSVLPILDLRSYFGSPVSDDGRVVVVGAGDRRLGLIVDELYDSYQSVLKSLGQFLRNTEGVSGVVFLGDGTPALMLDVERLVRVVNMDEAED